MTMRTRRISFTLAGCLALGVAVALSQEPAQQAILLNVSKRQLPNETGMDDKSRAEIVANFKELGGKAALNEGFRKLKGSDFEVVQPPPGYQPPPTD